MVINIIIGLAVLSGLIIVHELGHFSTAKAVGVRVDEFGLGLPPRLLSFKRGETRFSLNAIPLGGFTKMAGEEDPKEPRSLASKSIGARLLVLSAGSLMNALLPLILLSAAFMIPHEMVEEPVVVEEVAPNSPAARVGIEPGDMFLKVNENPVQNIRDLQRYIQLNLGKEVTMLIQHSDSITEEVQVVPRWKPPKDQGAIGIKLDPEVAESNRTMVRQSFSFPEAIPMGARECVEAFVLYKNGIISLLIGTVPLVVAGPVGIAQITGEVAKAGINPLLEFTALISLVLAICNLFPIPALDGGRIAFVLLEGVRRGKRISANTEGLVHLIGFVMLMAVMVAVTYQDIIRIISGGSLIP